VVCRSVGHDRETAKTTEPIEIQFGMWTRMVSKNHVLHGVHIITRERAMLRAKGDPGTRVIAVGYPVSKTDSAANDYLLAP